MTRTASKRFFFREWRKYRSLTLEKAGARIGMSHGNLSRLERGLQPYDQYILESLANAYLCEPADLLMRNPTDPEGIWSVWDEVPTQVKPRAIAVLKALSSTGTDG